MDNCTKFIFKNVNHTHRHNHVYSHADDMEIITGVEVGFCGLVIVGFTIWIISKKFKQRRNEGRGPVQCGLGYITD